MNKITLAALQINHWPDQDAERWVKARKPRKLLAKRSPADWRPATLYMVERGYGIYLAWLHKAGRLDASVPMEQRVSPELIENFAAEYGEGRAPLTIAGLIRDIAMMLRACAPPHGLPWLTRAGFSMMNAAKPVKPKLPHIASSDELLGLGEKLMAEGWQRREEGHRAGGQAFRDGLMIACMATRPGLRLGAFNALRLGYTLLRESDHWRFDIPPVSIKTKRRLRESFPGFLTSAIDAYVEQIRKELPARWQEADEGWLWLGLDGPLCDTSISAIFCRRTLEHLGKSISPHRFRDSAATTIALNIPEQIGITKSVLAHATLRSSQEHYNQAHSYSASSELADVIAMFLNPE